MEIEIESAEKRDKKFAEGTAEEHEGVATPREKEMACFVNHEVHQIGEEEAGGVAKGVEEEKRIGEEPGEAGVAGDGVPGLGFGERERHRDRVTVEKVERRSAVDDGAQEERDRPGWVEDLRLRFGDKRKELTQRTQRSERRGHREEKPKREGQAPPLQTGRFGSAGGRGRIVGEFAGNEASGAAEGEVEKAPLDEDDDAALEFDDVNKMDEEPDEPSDEARDVDAENVGDGGGAADYGHVAFVKIFEGRESAASKACFDEFAGVAAALDGNLGYAGKRIALRIVRDGQVAKDEDFGMIEDGEIRIDLQAAGAIGFGVEALGDFAAEGSGGDAAGPEDGASGNGAGSLAVLVADAFGINVGDEGSEHDFNTEFLDEFFGFGGEILGIRRENAWAAFHENDAGFLRADAAEVVFQRVVSDLGEGAGEFESCGAGADDYEGKPGAFFGFGFGTLGAFEGVEKLVTHTGGFFDGFETGGVFAPLVVAVVGGLGTGGDDERVVGKGATVGEKNFFGQGIDVDGFAEENLDILLVAEDGTDGGSDFSGGERASCDLVEEGLEEMEVALIEECDVHAGALEGLRGD